jgi:tetratricopeptide (TPR) repeat protein
VYLAYYQASRPATISASRRLWENTQAVGLVGLAAPGNGLFDLAPGLAFRDALVRISRMRLPRLNAQGQIVVLPVYDVAARLMASYRLLRDDGPVDALLLAVRAARRGLHVQPDDASAYLQLGVAYIRLLGDTRERTAAPAGSPLYRLRKVQAVTALATAARLRPDLKEAHRALALYYERMNYRDLELKHRRMYAQLAHSAGVPAEHLRPLDEQVQQLADAVQDRTNRIQTESYKLEPVGRAHLAWQAGLPAYALEILQGTDSSTLGRAGLLLKLHLLLDMGRATEVWDELAGMRSEPLAEPDFRALQAELAAATGDYARADQHLEALIRKGIDEVPLLKMKNVPFRSATALVVGKYLLDQASGQHNHLTSDEQSLRESLAGLDQFVRHQVDLQVVRGVLALEQGQVGRAQELLEDGLSLWRSDALGSGGLARHYLDLLAADPRR